MQTYHITVVLMTLALAAGPAVGGVAVGDAAVADGVPGRELTDQRPGVDQQFGAVEQRNDAQGTQQNNATFEPVQIEGETVSVAGVPLRVEQGLLTLRNGTLSLFVKRGAVVAGDASAAVTNARFAVGDDVTPAEARQVRRGIERGNPAVFPPEGVTHARFALGLVAVEANGIVFRDTNVNTSVGEPRVPPGGELAGPREGSFEVTNISAPENVSVGQSFEVSAQVRNPGDRAGAEVVQYRFGGVVVQSRPVTLGPGESETVTFEISSGQIAGEPGTYDHGVYAFASNQTAQITLTGGQNQSARS
ncbi:CARDB domain-containing protein [Haladaptatus salinisoli]|uniref:CARDB domain-containing protein n=1 Tax=Haladaptatus salinisoli TaxID=2884876 RepID=UPI001D0AF6F4|nr:CARDB domain-containing protein [Haladaptatus salinisoli]